MEQFRVFKTMYLLLMHLQFVREVVQKFRHFCSTPALFACSGGDGYDANHAFVCMGICFMQITPVKFISLYIHLLHRYNIMKAFKEA
jgi:hypothetical protein